MPSRWLFQYSLWKGGSVADSCVTRYCIGESSFKRALLSHVAGFAGAASACGIFPLVETANRAAALHAAAVTASTQPATDLAFFMDRPPVEAVIREISPPPLIPSSVVRGRKRSGYAVTPEIRSPHTCQK